MLRAAKWGFLSGLVVGLGVALSAAAFALVGGQAADRLPASAQALWLAYLGLWLAASSAAILYWADRVEAQGQGLRPTDAHAGVKGEVRRLYRFAAGAWLSVSTLAGLYAGIGLLVSTWGWWLGWALAALPFLLGALGYSALRSLRSVCEEAVGDILRRTEPLRGHAVDE